MYQKYAAALLSVLLMLGSAWFCVRGVEIERFVAANAFQKETLEIIEQALDYEKRFDAVKKVDAEALQPVIEVSILQKEEKYELSKQDYDTLLKIVEAEAGTEDETGKILVANVVLNRVESEDFPDTVTEVVYQKENGVTQFSPVANGTIEKVTVSEETVDAVELALLGYDISDGALYFAARNAADPKSMYWFDNHLDRLFAYGGHEFFR
ncbi:MAG: cell wall hydrolase [Lachnospiraceae bacterium]|nr:cell wall hydrolase [Lachnospiraceae bacterium]